ncbi:hypothetical protein HJC10_34370 [Corallococcus exiguus]|uniref:hypothetical protein n=1 Tax=Corallococcus TaxID=83461 RepID=UPI0011C41E2F|nr:MULTISPECIES: hypothetical protein [Corallococcus]NNB89810.1 hypothetical protein [Corallococcus exiguus]NNB95655.1 hypothetical protein [Corallococcus exiguus]NNC07911.1 hypothetical protein [Corallococcus exiguus]NPC47929.1 hypothetical protein [Corallococcus exiguus]
MSTVLTALLVAAGLALPGVAVFLRNSTTAPPRQEPTMETPRPPEETAPPARSPTPAAVEPAVPPPLDPLLPTQPEQVPRTRALVEDTSLPPLARSAAALRLLDAHWMRERWRSLARDAERVTQLDLPRFKERLPDEQARWTLIMALWNLREWDRMTKEGETFLRLYPESPMAGSVGLQMRNVVYNRDYERQSQKDNTETLRKAESQAAQDIAEREKRGEPTEPVRRKLALLRCTVPTGMFHQEALTACRAFQTEFGVGSTPVELNEYRDARGLEIRALVGLRRYTEARKELAAFLASDPEGDQRINAGAVVRGLAPDAEE